MSADPAAAVLDRSGLLERSGGDVDFLLEIAQLFLEECPRLVDEIRSACARGDAISLQHAAHTLRGCVANFGAEGARNAAARLESIARGADLGDAPGATLALEFELSRVTRALLDLSAELSRA